MSTAEIPRRRLIVITAGVMMALLLAALDQTIVGTAMPRIVSELHGLDFYSWVVTAYMVASTTMTPIAGKLGDLFGRKPFLLVGMIGFVGASALCGLSQDMAELVVFRSIQGISGGILFATVFTVLADIFPPQVRARMQGLFGAVFGLASILGPTAGGYITDNWGWRWVFYVNLPVGVLAVAIVASTMPFVRSRASWRDIDFGGVFTLAAGLIPLLIALSITRDHAWSSPPVVGLLALAAVMLGLFYLIERRDEHPIVPFELFADRTFAVSVVTGFLSGFGLFGTIVYVPLVFQGVLGVSATNSGQLLTPMMLGLIAASTIAGQLMVRIPRYRFIGTAGLALMMAGMWLLSQVGVSTPEAVVVRDIVIVGFGLGLTFPVYINAVQSALSPRVVGVATSQIQFWRNVGGTVGTAVLGSILARNLPSAIHTQLAQLKGVSPQIAGRLEQSGANPQSFLDPAAIAAARAALPAPLQGAFDQVMHAVRVALASSLETVFLYGAGILVLALVASVFMKDVPLRGRSAAAMLESAMEAQGDESHLEDVGAAAGAR